MDEDIICNQRVKHRHSNINTNKQIARKIIIWIFECESK